MPDAPHCDAASNPSPSQLASSAALLGSVPAAAGTREYPRSLARPLRGVSLPARALAQRPGTASGRARAASPPAQATPRAGSQSTAAVGRNAASARAGLQAHPDAPLEKRQVLPRVCSDAPASHVRSRAGAAVLALQLHAARLSELEPTTGSPTEPVQSRVILLRPFWPAQRPPSGFLLLAVRLHPRKFLHVPNRSERNQNQSPQRSQRTDQKATGITAPHAHPCA
jgi:hypothetical protein